jgi:hypothetical protein
MLFNRSLPLFFSFLILLLNSVYVAFHFFLLLGENFIEEKYGFLGVYKYFLIV